jgi:hypothetical protein
MISNALSRFSMASIVAIAAMSGIVAMVGGCGGSDSTRPAPPPPPPPPPPDEWRDVAGRSWTMPAESEGYVCFAVHLTSDEYLTGFRLVSPNAAQREVMLTVSDTPVTEGAFACNPGSLGPHLIYAASGATGPIEFPAGFGVHVRAGEYVWLNIHLDNAGDASVTDSTRVEARIGTAADVTTPIDMEMAGTFLINIPPDGLVHTATGVCYTSEDDHLLAFLPLMRSAGTHQTVSIRSDSATQVIFDQNFDLQHDDYTQPATPITVDSLNRLFTVCSYVNNGSGTLAYGESARNESCFAAIYRYPTSATGTLYDCAEGVASFVVKRE